MPRATAAVRIVLAAVALGASGGCTTGARARVGTDFALGWEGELSGPLLLPACAVSPQAVSPLFTMVSTEGRLWFRATAVGQVTLVCGERHVWVVRVLEPATFTVKAPTTLAGGQRATAVLDGFAVGGERLMLGAFADIDWKTTGAVRVADSLPHDFLGAAIRLHSDVAMFSIVGTAPGTGVVSAASWRGRPLDASATITVTAAASPDH
jgi:hypothetical protein